MALEPRPDEGAALGRERSGSAARPLALAPKLVDHVLAATFAGWAIGALFALGQGEAPPIVARVAMALLHASAAWLFHARVRPIERAPFGGVLHALPSLVLSGLAYRFGAARLEGLALVAFVVGALLAVRSLLDLGPSFGILVARRGLVVRGAYRVVRHPAYASELVMVLAAIAAGATREPRELGTDVAPGWVALALALAVLAAVVARVREEERLLARDPAYRAYAAAVRYRLVPGLF